MLVLWLLLDCVSKAVKESLLFLPKNTENAVVKIPYGFVYCSTSEAWFQNALATAVWSSLTLLPFSLSH